MKNIVGNQKIHLKKKLKKFWVQKNLWVLKEFFAPKNVGSEKNFGSEIFFGPVIVDFGGVLLVVLILPVTWLIRTPEPLN